MASLRLRGPAWPRRVCVGGTMKGAGLPAVTGVGGLVVAVWWVGWGEEKGSGGRKRWGGKRPGHCTRTIGTSMIDLVGSVLGCWECCGEVQARRVTTIHDDEAAVAACVVATDTKACPCPCTALEKAAVGPRSHYDISRRRGLGSFEKYPFGSGCLGSFSGESPTMRPPAREAKPSPRIARRRRKRSKTLRPHPLTPIHTHHTHPTEPRRHD